MPSILSSARTSLGRSIVSYASLSVRLAVGRFVAAWRNAARGFRCAGENHPGLRAVLRHTGAPAQVASHAGPIYPARVFDRRPRKLRGRG